MLKFLFMLLAFLMLNFSTASSLVIETSHKQNTTYKILTPKVEGVNRLTMIKQALVKIFDSNRRRVSWWSDLLTITAALWGAGAIFRILSYITNIGAAWTSYLSTLLFIAGAVFFLIWFFQMAARLS